MWATAAGAPEEKSARQGVSCPSPSSLSQTLSLSSSFPPSGDVTMTSSEGKKSRSPSPPRPVSTLIGSPSRGYRGIRAKPTRHARTEGLFVLPDPRISGIHLKNSNMWKVVFLGAWDGTKSCVKGFGIYSYLYGLKEGLKLT